MTPFLNESTESFLNETMVPFLNESMTQPINASFYSSLKVYQLKLHFLETSGKFPTE